MKLKLDEKFDEFVYDSKEGQFVNATRDRVAGLNKIIGNSSKKGAALPYAVAFSADAKVGIIIKGLNGGRSIIKGNEGEVISSLLLGSYYSRQREMLGFEEDVFVLKSVDGSDVEYMFPR
jgi:hypothetical protein